MYEHKKIKKEYNMKFSSIKTAVLVSLLIIPGMLFALEDGWEIVKDKKNIKTYKRTVEDSGFKEFKGIAFCNDRIEVIAEVLLGISGYTNWLEYITESTIIKKVDENNMVIYQRFRIKWPFRDRDCVFSVNIDRNYDTGTFYVKLHTVTEPDVPLKKGVVRVTDVTGAVIIRYIDREHTEVYFSEKINFGGNMPDWLINLINKYVPYKVLTGLTEECKKKKYAEAVASSVIKENIEKSIEKGILKEREKTFD